MKKIKEKILFLFVGLAALVVDQVSKSVVKGVMASRNGEEIAVIKGFFSIVHSYNTGVAFGLFEGVPYLFLYLPIVLVVLMIVLFFKLGQGWVLSAIGLGFMLGGALGNLIDRILAGKVFDFLEVYIGAAHWPTFNAADSFIVVGVFLFSIAMLRGESDA
jgi:signal peptidase II